MAKAIPLRSARVTEITLALSTRELTLIVKAALITAAAVIWTIPQHHNRPAHRAARTIFALTGFDGKGRPKKKGGRP